MLQVFRSILYINRGISPPSLNLVNYIILFCAAKFLASKFKIQNSYNFIKFIYKTSQAINILARKLARGGVYTTAYVVIKGEEDTDENIPQINLADYIYIHVNFNFLIKNVLYQNFI